MKHTALEFQDLKIRILKNIVFNRLLTATFTKNTKPFKIGNALIKVEQPLKNKVKESEGKEKNLPQYILAEIWVSLGITFSLGYSYKSYPIIWGKNFYRRKKTYISSLKQFASDICEIYPLHAAKLDKVFSSPPTSLKSLLEYSKISSNSWASGFSKKLKSIPSSPLNTYELEKYYEALLRTCTNWQVFNRILIALINDGRYEFTKPTFGRFSVEKTPLENTLSFKLYWYMDYDKRYTALVNNQDLNPISWEKSKYEIDFNLISSLFR